MHIRPVLGSTGRALVGLQVEQADEGHLDVLEALDDPLLVALIKGDA